jgi:hypothetical protein
VGVKEVTVKKPQPNKARTFIVTVHPIKGSEPKQHRIQASDASIVSPDSATEDPGIFCLLDEKRRTIFAIPLHRLIEAVAVEFKEETKLLSFPA